MVGPVQQRGAHVHDLVSAQRAGLEGAADAFVDGGDELLGDHAAHGLVREQVPLPRLPGLEEHQAVAVQDT